MPQHPVQYDVPAAKGGRIIDEHAAEAFRTSAGRLLDRLDAESRGKAGRTGVDWRRLRSIIDDAEAERTPWVAGMCELDTVNSALLIVPVQTFSWQWSQ